MLVRLKPYIKEGALLAHDLLTIFPLVLDRGPLLLSYRYLYARLVLASLVNRGEGVHPIVYVRRARMQKTADPAFSAILMEIIKLSSAREPIYALNLISGWPIL